MPVCFEDGVKRNQIYDVLAKEGIKTKKYFYPLTANFSYYKDNNLMEKYNLKNATYVSNRILCLPMYPDLEIADVDRITDIIKKIL
jgi:dTDP-4-amino-4,6-dideoxygalactose transaminase